MRTMNSLCKSCYLVFLIIPIFIFIIIVYLVLITLVHSITALALIKILLNNLANLIFHRAHTEPKLLFLNLQLMLCLLPQIKDIIILSHPLFLLYLSSIQIPIIILLLSIIITQILITSININTLIRK